MNISFQTNDEKKHVELAEIELIGSDEFCCLAKIKSGWLSCDRQFFFGKYYADMFLKSIKEMNFELSGEAILTAEFEDQIIKVSCTRLGKVIISGEFIEHSDHSQNCQFSFETDQTILPSLVSQFEHLLTIGS